MLKAKEARDNASKANITAHSLEDADNLIRKASLEGRWDTKLPDRLGTTNATRSQIIKTLQTHGYNAQATDNKNAIFISWRKKPTATPLDCRHPGTFRGSKCQHCGFYIT